MSFNMSALRASVGTIPLRQPVRVAQRPTALSMPSYTGLSLSGRLSMSSEGCSSCSMVGLPQNGSTVFAMRHRKRIAKLGKPADQRKALVRSLTTEVLRHGKITTTKVRAKAIRKHVDKMISLAKDGSLHARRQALAFVYDQSLVKTLFDEVPTRPSFKDRNGGYCRVIAEPQARRGDAAPMAAIELV